MALCLLGVASANAQLYITPTQFSMNDVTNEGIAVGSHDQNYKFQLWNPFTDEFTTVGGISAGNGIGGVARVTADGKSVFGNHTFSEIPVLTEWEKSVYSDFDYVFKGFMTPIGSGSSRLYAIGVRADGNGSIVLESSVSTRRWVSSVSGDVLDDVKITSFGYAGPYALFVGCEGGKLFSSKSNSTWTLGDPRPAGNETAVKALTAMDFTKLVGSAMYFDGGIGYEAEDGSYGVWYTTEASLRYADFHEAEGVSGVPTCIRLAGENFFMTTRNGHIQKSTDGCKTWQDIHTIDGALHQIVFADADKGIAIGDEKLYITLDGGETWTEKSILASVSPWSADDAKKWNDVTWVEDKIFLVGNSGLIYVSDNNGDTFRQMTNIPEESATTDFGAVYYSDNMITLSAGAGTFFDKMDDDSYVDGVCAGRYVVDTDTWTQLETLNTFNQSIALCAGSVEGISDDGKYIAGSAYAVDPVCHAAACNACVWDENGKITKLDNMFASAGENSKATAVSADGSVVVGWQDKNGPWMASVWRRQADGSYEQSLMFKDADTKIEDIDFDDFHDAADNCTGAANAVSPNGKWIGGKGEDSAWYPIKEAWIWSEETGYILTGDGGTTMEVSDDGSTAIGYGASGFGGWIWTKENGRRDLNTVAAELGADFDGFAIMSAYAMSPNGRYVAGWGMRGDEKLGYVLDLKYEKPEDSVETLAAEQVKASVYPNPVVSELHVDLPYDSSSVNTTITLYNIQGSVCRQLVNCRQSNIINVDGLPAGIYVLDVEAGDAHKVFKVIVK